MLKFTYWYAFLYVWKWVVFIKTLTKRTTKGLGNTHTPLFLNNETKRGGKKYKVGGEVGLS